MKVLYILVILQATQIVQTRQMDTEKACREDAAIINNHFLERLHDYHAYCHREVINES